MNDAAGLRNSKPGVYLSMTVGAEQDTSVNLGLDSLRKAPVSNIGYLELLRLGIKVVEIKSSRTSVVPTDHAAPALILDR